MHNHEQRGVLVSLARAFDRSLARGPVLRDVLTLQQPRDLHLPDARVLEANFKRPP
jgi:hypothetical protein